MLLCNIRNYAKNDLFICILYDFWISVLYLPHCCGVIICLIVVIWLKRSSTSIFTALNSMVVLVARQGITGVHSGADAESLFPCQSKRGYEFGGLFASGEGAVRDSAARGSIRKAFLVID